MTEPRRTDSVSQDPVQTASTERLVGREKILDALFDYIHAGQSVLLIGAAGMGKTAVLRALKARAEHSHTRRALYCASASTVKEVLKSVAEDLDALQRDIPSDQRPAPWVPHQERLASPSFSTLSIRKLRRLLIPWLRSGQYPVLLDHVGAVRGAYVTFLDELVEDLHVPIVVTARSLHPDESGRLWWVGCRFAKIEIPALTLGEARALTEETLDRNVVSLPDRQDFIRELVRLAAGNPRIITRICEMARLSRYQIGGRTDLRLLHLDLRVGDLQERIDVESRMPVRGPLSINLES